MSAAMALHVALSMRLDAIEAYRLAHAYRDEELQKFADRLASRATLYGDSRTVTAVIRDLRQIAGAKDSPATVCGVCDGPVVRFADERTGGGWMHDRGNDDASDDPANWADHAAVPVAPEEKASAVAPEVTPFFQPHRVYAHATYRFRCEYLVTHPTSGRTFAWGWFGKQGAGWRHASFSDRQYAARTWTDVTTTLGEST